jgi:hypothetical protein
MNFRVIYIYLAFLTSFIYSQTVYYSKNNLSYVETLKLYKNKNIDLVKATDFDSVYSKGILVGQKLLKKNISFIEPTLCKPLINSDEEIEAIIIIKSNSPFIDSLVIRQVLSSKFTTMI